MIFLINAVLFGFVANQWNRVGWANITCRLIFASAAVINAALSGPFVSGLLQ